MRIKIYGPKIEDYNPNEAIILWFLTPIAGVGVSFKCKKRPSYMERNEEWALAQNWNSLKVGFKIRLSIVWYYILW